MAALVANNKHIATYIYIYIYNPKKLSYKSLDNGLAVFTWALLIGVTFILNGLFIMGIDGMHHAVASWTWDSQK